MCIVILSPSVLAGKTGREPPRPAPARLGAARGRGRRRTAGRYRSACRRRVQRHRHGSRQPPPGRSWEGQMRAQPGFPTIHPDIQTPGHPDARAPGHGDLRARGHAHPGPCRYVDVQSSCADAERYRCADVQTYEYGLRVTRRHDPASVGPHLSARARGSASWRPTASAGEVVILRIPRLQALQDRSRRRLGQSHAFASERASQRCQPARRLAVGSSGRAGTLKAAGLEGGQAYRKSFDPNTTALPRATPETFMDPAASRSCPTCRPG